MQLTFPEYEAFPPLCFQSLQVLNIARAVTVEFWRPVRSVRFRDV